MGEKTIFMFSGQGSQYYQMGKDIYQNDNIFEKWISKLDKIACSILGESVVGKIYNEFKKQTDVFDNIQFTHPAIFMVEYSLAMSLIEKGIKPDYVLGSSLGEFVAAAVSGITHIEDMMRFVIRQALVFKDCCIKGGMVAVFENPNTYYSLPILRHNSELAAVNCDSHFVISGQTDKLNLIKNYLRSKEIIYIDVNVDFGFHSSFINSAEERFKALLGGVKILTPSIPCLSGLYGGNIVQEFNQDYFWDVVRKPIRFDEAIKRIERDNTCIYLDLGPGGTLAGFVKRNIGKGSKSDVLAAITPFGRGMESIKNICDKIFNNKNLHTIERKVRSMTAFVFPGQGSQSKGMGGELFDEFRELTIKADEILGYSIKELCLEDPMGNLGKTQYTQPALYVVNALMYFKKIKETGRKPDYVAGHSLAEYNALLAAEVFDFETGLRIVKKRGELMSKATGGGMAAVVGLGEERIKEVLDNNGLGSIDIANFNTPSQIVISGLKSNIENAKQYFESAGARNYVVLNVSGAFHSRYMEPARKEFEEFIGQFEFNTPCIPVISNVSARPYKKSDIKKNMIDQITSSVNWTNSIRFIMGKGEVNIVQVGPGTIAAGLVRNILREAEPLIVDEECEEGTEKREEIEKKEDIREKLSKTDKEGTDKKSQQYERVDGKRENMLGITAESLGSEEFKKEYNLKYAYLTGGMYKGIATREMVINVAKAGMMGFLGTGGLELSRIESDIRYIQKELCGGQAFGMNFVHNPNNPQMEEKTVDLFLENNITVIEAAAFLSITPALVKYRINGLKKDINGVITAPNRIIAKVSRPEVAEAFLSPANDRIIQKLLEDNKITREEAELSKFIPMACDITVEADSGGHTDGGVAYALIPAMLKLRDEMMEKYKYHKKVRIGAAGGIGTPEAAAAAFILGADYILTGSINQCTIEAGTSDAVKDMLQQINVQDTEYAPAGDMFELGAKVQVLKKGLFFPARANKLFELYRKHNSIDEIDEKTRNQIQEKYFKCTFDKVYEDVKAYYPPEEIKKAERNPKHKMALIFRWYFGYSTRIALSGDENSRVDYQVHCGPALGAFNQWVKGTCFENWKERNVDKIAMKLLDETAQMLNMRLAALTRAI